MIKHGLLAAGLLAASIMGYAEPWQPAQGEMLTEWGESITPDNTWQEYPRPGMVRSDWLNLNGLWQFVTQKQSLPEPQKWTAQILVPFVMESPLSGIGKRLAADEVMWYQRQFNYQVAENKRTLLNFEGADYFTTVWVNGQQVGQHKGGNLPFSFDISDALKNGSNEVVVKIIDDTDSPGKYQLRGKQKRKNGGIWYTPSSGIWQTVWLEQVPESYIQDFKLTADMHGRLSVEANIAGQPLPGNSVRVTLLENGQPVAAKQQEGLAVSLEYKQVKLWSPDSPTLYPVKIELLSASQQVVDSVESYAGFRTVGKQQDDKGNWRFTLNGKSIFHYGPLDQGWWPDGLLTPPSEQAYLYEMDYLKKAGFNMIRKHKKVEPRRYYYQADRLGFLVWQDQVSGGSGGKEWPKWQRPHMLSENYTPDPNKKGWWSDASQPLDATWPDWAHQQYMAELKSMIDTLYNHPSVVMWTTFNERWGQHRSLEVGRWVEQYDPSRYLNIASGGNFFEVGDIVDHHQYPDPMFPFDVKRFDPYVKVVGEFGGHGWPVEEHQWRSSKKKFVYGGMPASIGEYKQRYRKSIEVLAELKLQGVAAGVYTQTSDVEIEINGLLTYDRKVEKFSASELQQIHQQNSLVE